MKKLSILLVWVFAAPISLACYNPGPEKPHLIPNLVSFIEPKFKGVKDENIKKAEVKALLNLSGMGKVTKYTVIEVHPEWLDRKKIEKAISKSRFQVDSDLINDGVQDYLYVYEFEIKTINKAI